MTPPCRKRGKDCPMRRAGCHGECPAYKAYRAEQDRQNELLAPGRAADDYLYHTPRGKINRKGQGTK